LGFEDLSKSPPVLDKGEELLFVLEEETEFFYDGKICNVKAGDSYYFDTDRPHHSRSIGDIPAKFLVVFATKYNISSGG
jgi:mannose-6-phosphate isomerase-like protein (cupin superfamily)